MTGPSTELQRARGRGSVAVSRRDGRVRLDRHRSRSRDEKTTPRATDEIDDDVWGTDTDIQPGIIGR